MSHNITVGIDIGTRSTRVVVVGYAKNSPSIKVLGVGSVPSKGLRHGYIINKKDALKSVALAIKAAENSSGVKIKNAFLSIGGVSLESSITRSGITISRVDGEITETDAEKAIDLSKENLQNISNKRVIYTIPLHFKIDGKEVLGRPQGMKGEKLEVKTLFVTCLEQHVDDLIGVVEKAGVEVEDVVGAPIAAGLVALTKKQRTVGCLLANIGAETVSISVFEDDILVSLQVFPIGSTDITNDIALGLQIPLDEAEKIKVEGESRLYSKRKLDEIIEARLSDIFELIEAHLKKIKRSGLLPGGIIITGGGASLPAIEDLAKATLKLPSKIATPELFKNSAKQIEDSSWFVAYGLCIYGFQQLRIRKPNATIRAIRNRIMSWTKQLLP